MIPDGSMEHPDEILFFSMLCLYWEGRLWCGLSLKLRLDEASSGLAQC